MIRRWWVRRKLQRNCIHHSRRDAASWVQEEMINMGSGKLLQCVACRKIWII